MKKLSRIEMKKVNGGILQAGPPAPTSTRRFADSIGSDDGGTGCYKCCWDGGGLCSACSFSYAGAPCVSGATLSSCSGC